jgi:chromosomal replication initiation ATPase DnaA
MRIEGRGELGWLVRGGQAGSGRPRGGERRPGQRGGDPEARVLVRLVARQRQVPVPLLLHRRRCGADVAEARQLAMYLMHVMLRRSYLEVGMFFRRDRTTVAHACALIEDLRDRTEFDAAVSGLEAALAAVAAAQEANRAAG